MVRCPEKSLAELVGISVGELRKYMGMLHVHHLVKRYVFADQPQLITDT
jgi:hypothetical protein